MTNTPSADELDLQGIQQNIKRSAGWFYWIAALSVINSLVLVFNGNFNFVVGLGITQLIDGFALGAAEESGADFIKYIALGISILIAGAFGLCGVAGVKRYLPIYIIGIVFYVMDALIFLAFQDWVPVGFHAFALFNLWKAVSLTKEYRKLEATINTKEQEPVEAFTTAQ